jgi:hypothetical protein
MEPRSDGTVDYENGKMTNFFHSEYCLMEHIAMIQMISLAITAGYLTFDIYICYAKMYETDCVQLTRVLAKIKANFSFRHISIMELGYLA